MQDIGLLEKWENPNIVPDGFTGCKVNVAKKTVKNEETKEEDKKFVAPKDTKTPAKDPKKTTDPLATQPKKTLTEAEKKAELEEKVKINYAIEGFDHISNNTDGITNQALKSHFERIGYKKEDLSKYTKLINKYDLNCNQQIDQDEFIKMYLTEAKPIDPKTISEGQLKKMKEEKTEKEISNLKMLFSNIQRQAEDNGYVFLGVIGLFITGWHVYMMSQTHLNAQKTYWSSYWSYFDASYVFLNTLLSIFIFSNQSILYIRAV